MKISVYEVFRRLNSLMFDNFYTRWKYYKKFSRGIEIKPLSEEQKKEAVDYWFKLLHKRISPKWHELFYSITGVFTPRYLPLDIHQELIAKANIPNRLMHFIDDKNWARYFLKDFNIPVRMLECCNGVYYLPQEGYREVTRETALEYCKNLKDCIIKPSKDTSAGIGVQLFDYELFRGGYGNNFLIEKKIRCNENLRKLNPSSCNTLRVHTFRNKFSQKVEYVSAYVRIGKSGAIIDNSSTGGITCGIKEGKLIAPACMMAPRYTPILQTPSGVVLEGYKIEKFDEIVETCVNAHSCLPFFPLIGWDMTVDESNKIIIIEYNPNPGMKIGQLAFRDTPLLDKQEEVINSFL